jgi:hypothetical protein
MEEGWRGRGEWGMRMKERQVREVRIEWKTHHFLCRNGAGEGRGGAVKGRLFAWRPSNG